MGRVFMLNLFGIRHIAQRVSRRPNANDFAANEWGFAARAAHRRLIHCNSRKTRQRAFAALIPSLDDCERDAVARC